MICPSRRTSFGAGDAAATDGRAVPAPKRQAACLSSGPAAQAAGSEYLRERSHQPRLMTSCGWIRSGFLIWGLAVRI